MNDFNADGPSENEWEEQDELAWNEFDWERYLREQDDTIQRYLTHYEKLNHQADRIDETAHLMGWDEASWSSDEGETAEMEASVEEASAEDLPIDYEDLEP